MSTPVFPTISAPDSNVYEQAVARHNQLTKPNGSLGRLEEIGCWISACQGQCPPKAIENAVVVVFAGDHGVALKGVSAYPAEVSKQMAATISAGGAAINVLARAAGAHVRLLDVSLDHSGEKSRSDSEESVSDSGAEITTSTAADTTHIRNGSGSIDTDDAMSVEEYKAALAVGMQAADREVDSGADLLIAGDLGIGNTTAAAALIGTLTDHEPVVVVGHGTGIDNEGWKVKTAAIRDAMFRVRNLKDEPASILQMISSPDIVAMAGFLAQAAVRKTPVILDGVVVTAAALAAQMLAPGAKQWWIAGHRSKEPAHTIALEKLGLAPLVEYEMRLGEGSGAALALPIVSASVDILRDMQTFEEAGVSSKESE